MNKTLRILLLSLTFFASSCITVPITLAPSSSPLAPGTRGTSRAHGNSCQYYLLGLLPISTAAVTQDALDDAIRESRAKALTDVTVDLVSTSYIIFTTHCVHVRGRAVK